MRSNWSRNRRSHILFLFEIKYSNCVSLSFVWLMHRCMISIGQCPTNHIAGHRSQRPPMRMRACETNYGSRFQFDAMKSRQMYSRWTFTRQFRILYAVLLSWNDNVHSATICRAKDGRPPRRRCVDVLTLTFRHRTSHLRWHTVWLRYFCLIWMILHRTIYNIKISSSKNHRLIIRHLTQW